MIPSNSPYIYKTSKKSVTTNSQHCLQIVFDWNSAEELIFHCILELCEGMYVRDLCIYSSYTLYMFRHAFFLNVYVVTHFKNIKINYTLAHTISQLFLNTEEQKSLYRKWRATHLKERMERGTRFILICLSLDVPPTSPQIHLNSFQAGKWKCGSCPLFQRQQQRPGNSAIFYHQG